MTELLIFTRFVLASLIPFSISLTLNSIHIVSSVVGSHTTIAIRIRPVLLLDQEVSCLNLHRPFTAETPTNEYFPEHLRGALPSII